MVEEGGFLNFTNGKKPIHGPADFQGLRFRAMDPSQVALYEAFGASGTPIPGPSCTWACAPASPTAR